MEYSYWIIPLYKDKQWNYKILLINQKSQEKSFRWFPKGHKELLEDDLQTAKRELQEETWISKVTIIPNKKWSLHYTYSFWWEKRNKKVFFRVGYVQNLNVTIQTLELNEFSRCTKDEAIAKLTHKDAKTMLFKICSYLEIK